MARTSLVQEGRVGYRSMWRRAPTAGLALFLLLVGWYVLTMSGHTYSSDEETLLAAGESVIDTGSFAISKDLPLINRSTGADGASYGRYGPAQSLAAMPFIEAGRVLGAQYPVFSRMILRIVLLLFPVLVTAATGLLLYAWVRAMGYSLRLSLAVGLLYGLTSLAWPYSRTFFSEPLATFFLVLAAYGVRRDSRWWWVIAGMATAGALATKFQTVVALPVILIYVGLVCWQGDWRAFGRTLGARVAFGVFGLALPFGLLLLYNMRLYGGWLNVGYGRILSGDVSESFGGSWQRGLFGLTVSTGKGLLLYSPTILLGLCGLSFRWRWQWRESLLAAGMLAVHLAFYSRVSYWHGDGSWGPRYLVFVLPFLYLPAAGLLASIAGRRRRYAAALVGSLVVISFAVQLLPVLVNFDVYLNSSKADERYFVPSASPIVGHIQLWSDRVSRWWVNAFPAPGTAMLSTGFSYSEGDRSSGELLPRWTYSDGLIKLYPNGSTPIEGRIVAADHRPWPLPRASFFLLLDDSPLGEVQRRDLTGQNLQWELSFQLPSERLKVGSGLDVRSDTWNPSKVTADNKRNEDLGVKLESLELSQNGQKFKLQEELSIPPPPRSRYGLWQWYQNLSIYHLFDSWLWYVFAAGMPRRAIAALLGGIALPALACLAVGLRGVWSAFRSEPLHCSHGENQANR